MGHDKLRPDTECQNCGHTVDEIYCPHCGQKNTETRQSFAHLAGHFAEDLTHYDSGFWRTIKYLIFRPAKLTTEYLIGKRQLYVPPVKLYIFISFVTFLLMSALPNMDIKHEIYNSEQKGAAKESELANNKDSKNIYTTSKFSFGENSFSSVEEFEHYQDSVPESKKYSKLGFWMIKKTLEKFKENDPDEILPKFLSAVGHNFPKLLFIYMPIFAFWLWLFHNKKRWFFFDHAIFTLHYFSLMLLLCTFMVLVDFALYSLHLEKARDTTTSILIVMFMLYSFLYFFVAHKRMYHQKSYTSIVKGTLLFVINFICMSIAIFALAFYTFINLH